jgi:hypothetical protein
MTTAEEGTPIYAAQIRKCFADGKPTYDVRHIEAAMRMARPDGCLDSLTPRQFLYEVFHACSVIAELGPEDAEKLALSYGL